MPHLLIALNDYWQQSDRLSEFLNIAIQLADALHYLTQQRIVHKDIKPANILICPQTQIIKLIDFSISSLLPQEQQQLINPNVLERTLAYIYPEQTGRMNRGMGAFQFCSNGRANKRGAIGYSINSSDLPTLQDMLIT